MDFVLYELCGADGRSFSPYCWRTRMALAHKGIHPALRKVRFTDIPAIADGVRTVPVLVHGAATVRDSWDIAVWLDENLSGAPGLFAGDGERRLARFMHHWVITQLHPLIFRAIAADIWDRLDAADQPYFRASREQRLGAVTLESLRAQQPATIAQLRSTLAPLRGLLGEQQFVGGALPTYADYIAFGALQWPRVVGNVALLEPGDPVAGWFERCLDLHGGLGRAEPAARTA